MSQQPHKNNSPMVTLCTQVYNTKAFLPRCVESVLNQTYASLEYLIIDNGCTDGSTELLSEYAANDSRIRLIRLEKNDRTNPWLRLLKETASGKYIGTLDSDDWIEPNYLERLLNFAEQSDLDIAATGTVFHNEGAESQSAGFRILPKQIVVEKAEFAEAYPYYHQFMRAVWGKLIRHDVFLQSDYTRFETEKLYNGADTLLNFIWLRNAQRIGIDNTALHHYLMRRKSVYHTYNPARFRSVTTLYEDAVDFLSGYGPISAENRNFIARVYANGLYDALEVLQSADMPEQEKLAECKKAAEHPDTRACFAEQGEDIDRCRRQLLETAAAVAGGAADKKAELIPIVNELLPRCAPCFDETTLPLFEKEPQLFTLLLHDDRDGLIETLLRFVSKKRYIKQFDIGAMISGLLPEENPLRGVTDVRFYWKYLDICRRIICENYFDALEQMTGLLLERRKLYAEEAFLTLYLRLVNLTNNESAMIFGEIRFADYCLRQGRNGECRMILDQLIKIGVAENEDIKSLCEQLDKVGETT